MTACGGKRVQQQGKGLGAAQGWNRLSRFGYIPSAMYEEFRAMDRWSREELHCAFQALVVAVATRHADAVDIKFLVNGRPVWIALPHPAWVEYRQQTGEVLSDVLAVQAAGRYLKSAIESGLEGGRDMYTLTVEETLEHLYKVRAELNPAKTSA